MGTEMGSPINDCHNLGASNFIAISGIHMLVTAQPGRLWEATEIGSSSLIANSIDR